MQLQTIGAEALPRQLAGEARTRRDLQIRSESIIKLIPKFLDCSIRGQAYNEVTDDANAPPPLLTAPYEPATRLEAPLTLPEYVAEVEP